MSATDKEQPNNDTGELIVMTGTEKSKRCQRIFNSNGNLYIFAILTLTLHWNIDTVQ